MDVLGFSAYLALVLVALLLLLSFIVNLDQFVPHVYIRYVSGAASVLNRDQVRVVNGFLRVVAKGGWRHFLLFSRAIRVFVGFGFVLVGLVV